MKFLKFIFFIICIASFQPQSAISIRFKTKPAITIDTTEIKNCSAALGRAAFYSLIITGVLYFNLSEKAQLTSYQYMNVCACIAGMSLGKDIGYWIAPIIIEKLKLPKKEAQPQSPSSIIYSAAP